MLVGNAPIIQFKQGSLLWAVQSYNNGEQQHLQMFFEMNTSKKFVNRTIISLLAGLLNENEMNRLNAMQILQHQWLNAYYQRYQRLIYQTSIAQRIRLQINQSTKMRDCPYYYSM